MDARTHDEAHLYMDLSPCACGEIAFDRTLALTPRATRIGAVYEGACHGCGRPRRFEFELPAKLPDGDDRLSFGGPEPSQLIDAGQFLAVSDQHARGGDRRQLELAVAALDEVLKFIPSGADAVPESALFSKGGRALHRADPRRFRRQAVEAARDEYLERMARLAPN